MSDAVEDDRGRAPAAWGFRRGARLAGMVAAAIVVALALTYGGAGSGFDESLYASLYVGGDAGLTRSALFLSDLGGWRVLVPLAVIASVLLAFKRRLRAATLLVTVFGGRLLVELMKVIVDRDRPGQSPHLEAVHSMSFPSGHAGNAMITFLALALLLPVRQRYRAVAVGIALALALQIGWSRVALGVHWPTDVIGGWSLGILWVALCMRLASERPEPAADV